MIPSIEAIWWAGNEQLIGNQKYISYTVQLYTQKIWSS